MFVDLIEDVTGDGKLPCVCLPLQIQEMADKFNSSL